MEPPFRLLKSPTFPAMGSVLIDDEELLLPYEQFPWFKQATVEQISHVEHPSPDHLYGPSLDVDLSVSSIRRPQDFPLVSHA